MSQQYSLRWNNHQPNFISMFTTLLNTQTLVDVTLSADGKQLLAHKVVLSACSTYFQSLFVDNPSPHPIVILKDVTYADLRTMVDFMYCGEVNVTEEQLPKVLDTAKLLKIKGLTEMPDSTSLTRSQGTSAEFQNQGDSMDSQRQSPAASPSNKRRRRRKSSSGSTSLNVVENEQGRADVAAQTVDAITLSSVPQQQRRMREYHEIRTIDNSQQTTEQDLNVEQIGLENTPTAIPQATVIGLTGSYSPVVPPAPAMANSDMGWQRRTKHFKRQSRVPDEQNIRKQTSEPLPPTPAVSKAAPTLQKHESYPQYNTSKATLTRKPRLEQEVGSLLIRAVSIAERQSSTSTSASATTATSATSTASAASAASAAMAATSASASFESTASDTSQTQRASHTPAVRSGPPLSCNFCWNTVDECGRILRRKTQYHCPECRTNLCIVPCFHEYHDGPESDSNTNTNAR
ncbi:longitudinals lacking protein, isoforms H/M/V isoform X2 [Spodoptera frugiperda]|uniref:Longitudinals lacking protein, isoforms H/M/V isoform X2 n=1 Tax=Spodoptera frugiperda TaxID=7108 RepID=A0A9R0D8R4_SPOFR|nr:longitudinals lacking protein, isoforms H/M/V isoform X2 [Spodoptera frugiperda]